MKRTPILAINFDHVLFNNKLKERIITLLSFADNQFLLSNLTYSDRLYQMTEAAKNASAAAQQDIKENTMKAAKSQSLSGINSMLVTHGLEKSKFLVKGDEVSERLNAKNFDRHDEIARQYLMGLKDVEDSNFSAKTPSTVSDQIVSKYSMKSSINSSPANKTEKFLRNNAYYNAVKDALSTSDSKHGNINLLIIGDVFFKCNSQTKLDTVTFLPTSGVKDYTKLLKQGANHIGLHEYTQQLMKNKKLSGKVLKDLAALRYELQCNSPNDTNRKFALEFHRLYDLKLTKTQRRSLVTLEVMRFGETFKNEIDPPEIVRLKTEASASIMEQFSIISKLKSKKALTTEILIKFIDNFYPCLTLAKKKEFVNKILDEELKDLIKIPLRDEIKEEKEITSTPEQFYKLIRKTLLDKLSNQKVQNSSFLENCRQVAEQVTWFPKSWVFGIIARIFLKPDYSDNLKNITYKPRPTCSNFEEFKNSASVFLKCIQDSLFLTKKTLIIGNKITISKDSAKPIVFGPNQRFLKITPISTNARYNFFTQHFSSLTWREQRNLRTQTAIYKSTTSITRGFDPH